MPEISIIVPVYKVEPYICRCVDSILKQTFTDFELLLIDDGSPDNCGTICDEYAKKDKRIHVIHQKNGGLSAARNAGIDWSFVNSESRWLTFVDSDDWIHPRMIEELYRSAIETGVLVSICEYQKVTGNTPRVVEETSAVEIWTPKQFYLEHVGNVATACGKLYKKECFEEIRYPNGKTHEDEYVTYQILFACERLAVIWKPYYNYFQSPDSITRSAWSPKRLDVFPALEEEIAFFERYRDVELVRFCLLRYMANICEHIILIDASQTGRKFVEYRAELVKKGTWTVRTYKQHRRFFIKQYIAFSFIRFPMTKPLYFAIEKIYRLCYIGRKR